MNTNNSMLPKDLMDTVEGRLRMHVQQKKKKRKIRSAALAIFFALIIPCSVLAYNDHIKNIPYKQEIDLAREHNDTYKIDKSFKYKDVEFKFKEILADETGIVVIYDVSNPEYYINSLSFKDANNSTFDSWGFSLPGTLDPQTERVFHISISKNTFSYMKNNPIIINIDEIGQLKNPKRSLFTKLKDLVTKDKSLAVDWTIKTEIPLQNMKTVKLDKEISLDIGTLKLTTFKEGILHSYVNYEFIPNNKNIIYFRPIFSVRADNEYYNFSLDTIPREKGIELKSTYYKKPKEIGLTLVGAQVRYSNKNQKEYTISKENLPAEYEFNDEKFRLISAKETGDSIEYDFQFNTIDRTLGDINIQFNGPLKYNGNTDKIKYKDISKRNAIYENLSSKIPNYNELFIDTELNTGIVTSKYTVSKNCNNKFTIKEYERTSVYNIDEYIIKPENLK